MRSGVIRSEVRERQIDRRELTHALWEQGSAAAIDLPWRKAGELARQDIGSLVANARIVVIAVGKPPGSSLFLEMALESLEPGARTYVYAGRDFEKNRRVTEALSQRTGTVLARLGFEPPADWIVADGRRGLLLVGPPGGDRRWAVPVEGALASTLFEAFQFLFWHHSAREGLPDLSGAMTFRTPLAAPFPDPGKEAAFPSGRLVVDGLAPEPMTDAEIRVAPDGVVSGPAATVFVPPRPQDFSLPKQLTRERTRVVWSDLGLPRTSVSRERAILSFQEPPLSLQLEWPRADAITLYHRLSSAAQKPTFCFHAARRLADVTGPALLEGAAQPATVQESMCMNAPEVTATFDAFEGATPPHYPEPPPLAKNVTYRFRVSPVSVPPGAREADLVRRWRTADEWARRRVDTLREVLTRMEGDESGFLDRLRTWLTGHDAFRQRRTALLRELEELGEAPPSQQPDRAADLLRRMGDAFRETRQLVETAHSARIKAEDAAAEAQQKAAWKERVSQASAEAKARRAVRMEQQERESVASAELDRATTELEKAMERKREERASALASKRDDALAEIEKARENLKNATDKTQVSQAGQRISEIEGRITRLERDIESLPDWRAEVPEESAAVKRARAARDVARQASKKASEELETIEARCREPFDFRPPPRPSSPDFPPDAPPPALPSEAPPELGELFEEGGKRYLAVKTWEQAQRAGKVARRLHADLVALPREIK